MVKHEIGYRLQGRISAATTMKAMKNGVGTNDEGSSEHGERTTFPAPRPSFTGALDGPVEQRERNWP
jgi:hypothetical protein